MTGREFERALLSAATEAVELATTFVGAEARGYAAGILDGARHGGLPIESPDMAATIVMRAHKAAMTRMEAVGL
jgi:hypothetical protein